ncbi:MULTISPECIES: DUF4264 family protein [Sporomusaceae]|uniref:DUF4264 domain-containing protein n=1 Tax=Sporolituus thermophilus DSM 23256 TaxID=1123285 RepID=A0A1G7M6X0_9FIRM|nr:MULTISPECIES: DUF4264 family protein [Sporomusaceae]SDF57414.1 Protein of unknown function [Sporolituus thermophilus DSM 23256]
MNEELGVKGKLEIVASKTFAANAVLVDVVDFLNKSLKKDGYIFGVSKSGEKMTIVIYEAE